MPFPEKFRELIEIREDQVTVPDVVYLAYGVCAAEEESCGWGGWIVESAKKIQGAIIKEVEADTEQRCPVCGRVVFRTIVKRFLLDPDWNPTIAYDVVPIAFVKSKT
jgi:hypothetical protein